MANIHDVAALAGVSISSVSNVINGRVDKMSAKTLARIKSAIEELNYQPNRTAQQLKSGQSKTLGLLVPSTANPMYGELALRIETYAQERYGFRLVLANTHRDRDKELGVLDDFLAYGVRSAIVVSSLEDEEHLQRAALHGMTIVSYDRSMRSDASGTVHYVSQDNFKAGYLAASHLIENGHRNLAFAVPDGRTISRKEKIAGFRARAHQQPGVEISVLVANLRNERDAGLFGDSGLAAVGANIALQVAALKPRCTGIIAVNDMMAIGIISGLSTSGLVVPNDVSVIGMDGLSLAEYSNPGLTTVAVPMNAIAEALVCRAIGSAQDSKMTATTMCFEPKLIARQSVARLSVQ